MKPMSQPRASPFPGTARPTNQTPIPGESRTTLSGYLGRREAAEALARSAARGRELARLPRPRHPRSRRHHGRGYAPELAAVAVPATTDGRNMAGGDFALTTGWGHYGAGGAVMPGQGRIVRARLHPGGTRRPGRRPPRPRPDHVRRVPERPRLLAQHPRRRLALPARRLPGPQEVALLPRSQHPRPPATPRGGAAFYRYGKTNEGDTIGRDLSIHLESLIRRAITGTNKELTLMKSKSINLFR